MSAYEKLVSARLKLQSAGMKKTGHNKFSGYDYYELGDFIPFINRIANELKFACVVTFGDVAELRFVDFEDAGNPIVFTSPMSTASLKGCHEVQNLGAVETYIKRYLYQHCFEIVESDALDAGHDEKPSQRQAEIKPASKISPEMEAITKLIETKYNGEPIFDERDKGVFRDKIREVGAHEAFYFIEEATNARLKRLGGQ